MFEFSNRNTLGNRDTTVLPGREMIRRFRFRSHWSHCNNRVQVLLSSQTGKKKKEVELGETKKKIEVSSGTGEKIQHTAHSTAVEIFKMGELISAY